MALTDKLTAIADAIRAKLGESGTMTLAQMQTKIASIPTGITPSGTKVITQNGSGIDVTAFAAVDVNVPIPVTLNCKTWEVTIASEFSGNKTWVSGDDWIKANYNNPNLRLVIYAIGSVNNPASGGEMIALYAANNSPLSGEDGKYIATLRKSDGSSGYTQNPYPLNYAGSPQATMHHVVTSGGDLKTYAGSSSHLAAATYKIIMFVL